MAPATAFPPLYIVVPLETIVAAGLMNSSMRFKKFFLMSVPPGDQIYKQNADTRQERLHRNYL